MATPRSLSTAILTLTLALTAVQSHAAVLVATNSTWSWRKGTAEPSNPTTAWHSLSFNDTAWDQSQAPFYYDTGNDYRGNTLLADMASGYTTFYLRHRLVIPDTNALGSLRLRSICDDGFVLWINGTEAARFNMTGNNFPFTATASVNAAEPLVWTTQTLPNAAALLVPGTNLVAVQAFNRPNSSDFLIELEISSDQPDRTPPALIQISPPSGTVSGLREITVRFSEPVTDLAASDLLVNQRPAIGLRGAGDTYTFELDATPYGEVHIGWDPGARITDLASPPNLFDHAHPTNAWTYRLVDLTPPAIQQLNPAPNNTVRSLSQIEITFSEPVSGVDAADLLINNQPASSATGADAGPYLFRFDPAPTGAVRIEWTPQHGIRDQAADPNPLAATGWSYAVDPAFIATGIRINEILTGYSGDTGLRDEDGDLEDWIELANRGTTPVNLQGWALTDDPDEPGKWTFPSITLAPGQYLVVFASGKDRRPTDPARRLHTNFKLSSTSEYLGLFNGESPRGAVSQFAPEYPEQRNDRSYGFDPSDNPRYFATPTPGVANPTSTIQGVVPPVIATTARGFFDNPFPLTLSDTLDNVRIRFTTDGSVPTETTGRDYTSPINVSNTTILRAAAFRTGYLPSLVATHTYIFLDQVLRQPALPPGVPSTWIDNQNRPWTADYEMDPEIVDAPAYRDLVKPALLALPTLSIVTRPEDMFDNTRGIYPKSLLRGSAWERPASIEWIDPTTADTLQINGGIQMQGNANREPIKTAKHAFRLVFKGDYGPKRLNLRLFPDSPVEEFDTVILRADFNNSWMHWDGAQRPRGQRVRDAFMKDSQRAMSGFSAHNRFVHLYINGLYWGLYDPVERPDAGFAASYFGGTKADYDIVNEGQIVDGNMTAYNTMINLANLDSPAQYNRMKEFLDVPHYIDYMLLHFYVAHQDWGLNKNWYTLRRRAQSEGFKYIAWDGELMMNGVNENRVTSTDTASGLHTKLVASAQYRLDFADRTHKHLFNNGALTPAAVAARYSNRIAQVELALVAESARWGDYRRDVHQYSSGPYLFHTRNEHFYAERNRLLNTYFPQRPAILLRQLQAAGLYPANAVAPTLSQDGGWIAPNSTVSLTAPSGTVYYTTNGTDPRVPFTGQIAPDARTYTGPVPLSRDVTIKSRSLLGSEWSALTEAAFQVGSFGVPLQITEIMYNPPGGDPYEFVEIQNTGALPLDIGGFSFGGIQFLFPPGSVLAPAQIIVLASGLSPISFANRYPGLQIFGYFDGTLSNNGERLAILDPAFNTVASADYQDDNGWPTAADGGGYSIETHSPQTNPDPDAPANWRASASPGGSPGRLPRPLATPPVRISEILADNAGLFGLFGGSPDYVELHNSTDTAVSIAAWTLTDSADPARFVFPADTAIPANGYLAIWCRLNPANPFAISFALDLNGESLFLHDASGNLIDALSFGRQLHNLSLGRLESSLDWHLCVPTPGASNTPQPTGDPRSLVLNEWLANPISGDDDWLELHNPHPTLPIDLRGVFIGSNTEFFQIRSPSFIAPLGHLLLRADRNPGPDHLDLRLPAAGATLALYTAAGELAQRLTYSPQSDGVSEGRLPDASSTIVRFPNSPTPGRPNSDKPQLPRAPVIESFAWTAGILRLTVAGDAGRLHSLEASPDLRTWTTLTQTNPPTTPFTLTLATSPNSPHLFYRLRVDP